MRQILPLMLIVFLLVTAPTLARDWEWVSGGNFNSITIQGGGDASPANDVVWLAGNLLVKGVRQNGGWNWTQVSPELTESSPISGLVFFDSNSAMALTGTGVAYTSNGASTWTVFPLPDWIQSLNGFQMTDPSHAYAVGRNTNEQAILVSTDNGGATWNLLYDSGEWPGSFTGLQVYGDGHATLVGNYFSGWIGWFGVVVETDDNFQTVSRVDYDNQALWSLEAPSRDHHYALGGPDLPGMKRPIFLYRHQEHGGWQQSTLPADIFQILGMTFDSALHGWVAGHFDDPIIGSGGVLLETADGGETWTRTDFCQNCVTQLPIIEEPVSVLHSVAEVGGELFVAQNASAWPCSSGVCTGRVLTSSDGQQWNRVEQLTGYRYADIDLAAGPLRGIAVGFDGSFRKSFTQTLSGGMWQDPLFHEIPCPFPGTCPPRWAGVQIIQNSEVWGLTEGPASPAQLMKSLDKGATWVAIDTGEEGSFQVPTLSVVSPDSIWTAITTKENAGKIIATSDRGETWTTILNAGVGNRFNMVAHVSDTQFCYVTRGMACTKDGGKTWSYPAGPSEYTDLQLLDEEYGWSVGVSAQGGLDIYRTTNGGTTWNKLTHLEQTAIRYPSQMHFLNRQEGWLAVGAFTSGPSNPMRLLKTVDGGETWTEETDGVFLAESANDGFVYDVAADGSGWLASRFSGTLLRRSFSGPIAPGDANGDGKLDSGDLLAIVEVLNDDLSAGVGADCNQDGKIDVGDLICVLLKLEQK